MKKSIILSIVLVVGLLASACATVAVPKVDYGKGVEMSLDFITNPSTGYDWVYELNNDEKSAEIYLVRQDNDFPDTDLIGSGGHRIYYFRATKEGKQTLTFTYRRPWEGGEVAYDVVYDLEVDKDMNITCTAKKKGVVESDKELSFFPDPVFSE